MVDQPGAIPMWVPQNITFDYTDATWCVIHKTAGFQTAQDCAAYFQSGSGGNNVSSHYIVGLDGTIVQCVPESRGSGANCCTTAGHASYLPTDVNLNLKTISIEHIDPSSNNSTPMPEAQKAASFQLVHDICVRHNIPMRGGDASGGVIGHKDIDPINRARCPGNYAWDELWTYLNGNSNNTQGDDMLTLSDPWAAGYFQDNGNGQWKCKNGGHIVGGNILKYYCVTQGAARLPITEEIKDVPNHPEVAYQLFESGIIVFDPNHVLDGPAMPSSYGCYFVKLGTALAQKLLSQPLLNQIASLNAQIASLQQQLQSTQNANVQALQQQIQTLTAQLSSAKSALAQIATEATAAGK